MISGYKQLFEYLFSERCRLEADPILLKTEESKRKYYSASRLVFLETEKLKFQA